jgi:thiol-disulfide isomerase/thioredoxin
MIKSLLIILLSASFCLSASTGFTAGPYLLNVKTDSATVAFHIEKPLSAKIKVFQSNDIKEFQSDTTSKSHFINVSGLKPGLTYNYQVICGNGEIQTPENDKRFQIKTACRQGESFSFVVYGDTRPGDNKTDWHHKEIINQIVQQEPSFAIVLGDMVDDGASETLWTNFFQIESNLLRKAAIYPILGDNDFADSKGLYRNYFPFLSKGYYKFEWGGVQFFGLNAWGTRGNQKNDEFTASSPQIKWLESELSKPEVQNSLFRVVFLHDPIFISRGKSSELLRRTLVPIFKKYNIDVVFASWHLYERSINDDINYIITGGAGAELIWLNKDNNFQSQADAREYHFCRVDINSGAMTISAIAENRTVLDTITLIPRHEQLQMAQTIEDTASKLVKEYHISADDNNPSVPLYFFSSDCDFCKELLNKELPKLAKENNVSLEVSFYELKESGAYRLLKNAEAKFGKQNVEIPAIFIGNSVLGGEAEIKQNLHLELKHFKENPSKYLEKMITPFSGE